MADLAKDRVVEHHTLLLVEASVGPQTLARTLCIQEATESTGARECERCSYCVTLASTRYYSLAKFGFHFIERCKFPPHMIIPEDYLDKRRQESISFGPLEFGWDSEEIRREPDQVLKIEVIGIIEALAKGTGKDMSLAMMMSAPLAQALEQAYSGFSIVTHANQIGATRDSFFHHFSTSERILCDFQADLKADIAPSRFRTMSLMASCILRSPFGGLYETSWVEDVNCCSYLSTIFQAVGSFRTSVKRIRRRSPERPDGKAPF